MIRSIRDESRRERSISLGALTALALCHIACSGIHVQPVQTSPGPSHVCIEFNGDVTVPDFVDILRSAFERNSITTNLFYGTQPQDCEFVLSYTGYMGWDFAPFVNRAEMWLKRGNGYPIGFAEYINYGGIFGNLEGFRWRTAETIVNSLIDQLMTEPLPEGSGM